MKSITLPRMIDAKNVALRSREAEKKYHTEQTAQCVTTMISQKQRQQWLYGISRCPHHRRKYSATKKFASFHLSRPRMNTVSTGKNRRKKSNKLTHAQIQTTRLGFSRSSYRPPRKTGEPGTTKAPPLCERVPKNRTEEPPQSTAAI